MGMNYAYNFAYVDPTTRMCINIVTTTDPTIDERDDYIVVALPVYDENYLLKYYINGEWYEDAEGTIPWRSALLGE